MSLFRRVLRFLFFLGGFLLGVVAAIAAFFTRQMVNPARQRLWASPDDLGLPFEDVQFPAQDGVRLSGWFVPAGAESRRKNATIVLVHGWLWNRLGAAGDDLLSTVSGGKPVDMLRLMYGLHQEGFNVFMFDMRNHGESAGMQPVSFGQEEAKDLLGAVAYLEGRDDVDNDRIGVIGFSAGANAALYALPQTNRVRAAVAVQPTSTAVFAPRYGGSLLGPLSQLVIPMVESMYQASGGLRFAALTPTFAAAGISDTPVLFIQGKGDPWGTADDVMQMAEATPHSSGPLLVDSDDRYGGYTYLLDNPKIAVAFFEQHFPE